MPRRAFVAIAAALLLASSASAAQVAVAVASGTCRTKQDCLAAEKCHKGKCVFSAAGKVMRAWKGLPNGSICLTDRNCKHVCRNMRCRWPTPVGAPCKTSKMCKGMLVCKARKCVHPGKAGMGGKPIVRGRKKNGMKCKWNAECRNACIRGTCAMPRPAGHPCWLTSDCKGALVCKRSKCQVKRTNGKRNGLKCKHDWECRNVCIFGRCDRLRRFGETCKKGIHCRKGLICKGGKCRTRKW